SAQADQSAIGGPEPAGGYGMWTDGSIALSASEPSLGNYILELLNVSSGEKIGTYDLGTAGSNRARARDLVIQGNRVYLLDSEDGLRILDIAVLADPVPLGQPAPVPVQFNSSLVMQDNFAYVTVPYSRTIHIFDTTVPGQI